jgi:iron-sulfur cluster assembly protein
MALKAQQGVLAVHAAAVVGDAHKSCPAAREFDAHTPCASVDAVFDEFLHYRSGALYDLACRDLAGDMIGEKANVSHAFDFARIRSYEKSVITLTDAASKALIDLIASKGSGDGLRLSVEKGGCAGLQYTMEIGTQLDGDTMVEHLGARVFIDAVSGDFLKGSVLDHEDGLSGAGFRIRNPLASRSCGCGTSFEPTGETAH